MLVRLCGVRAFVCACVRANLRVRVRVRVRARVRATAGVRVCFGQGMDVIMSSTLQGSAAEGWRFPGTPKVWLTEVQNAPSISMDSRVRSCARAA